MTMLSFRADARLVAKPELTCTFHLRDCMAGTISTPVNPMVSMRLELPLILPPLGAWHSILYNSQMLDGYRTARGQSPGSDHVDLRNLAAAIVQQSPSKADGETKQKRTL